MQVPIVKNQIEKRKINLKRQEKMQENLKQL